MTDLGAGRRRRRRRYGTDPRSREPPRAAGVPIMVAVNKMDKPTANPDRVLQELPPSASCPKTGAGTPWSVRFRQDPRRPDEMLALQADILELTASPGQAGSRPHRGSCSTSSSRATAQWRPCSSRKARSIRATPSCAACSAVACAPCSMTRAARLKRPGRPIPVEVQGFEGVPEAGEEFICLEDEKLACRIAESRAVKLRERELAKQSRVTSKPSCPARRTIRKRSCSTSSSSPTCRAPRSHRGCPQQAEHGKGPHQHHPRRHRRDHGIRHPAGFGFRRHHHRFNVRPTAKVKEMAEHESVDIRFYDISFTSSWTKSRAPWPVCSLPSAARCTSARPKCAKSSPCRRSVPSRAAMSSTASSPVTPASACSATAWSHNGKIASLRRFKDDVREVLRL